MGSNSVVERRQYVRHPLATSIQFEHESSHREYPGRCMDVSRGGLLMYVPVSTPLQVGHAVRVRVGSVNRPEFSGLSEKPTDATIVRVDRHGTLTHGQLAVGVRFHEVQP